jgi:hypothetical protein
MHDPMVVAFEIRRPWPRRSDGPPFKGERWSIRPGSAFWTLAGRRWWFPPLITVWHVEPGGKDSGEVCPHYRRWQKPDGTWTSEMLNGWRFHVKHWHVQVRPIQALRRWLLTRCEWCGGPSRKRHRVNVSHQWDRKSGPWWRGDRGLYHVDCSSAEHAARSCACPVPVLGHRSWGRCAVCGRFRGHGAKPEHLAFTAVMQRCAPSQAPSPELLASARAAKGAATAS